MLGCRNRTLRIQELIFPTYPIGQYPLLRRKPIRGQRWLFAAIVLFLATQAFCARKSPTAPQLTYIKVMKGSIPAYEKIVVRSDGSGRYDGRSPSEASRPRGFRLSPAVTAKLFSLAGKLHDFKGIELESHKHVADLGLKTFQYEDGGQINQVQFNYSLSRTAQELTDLFESVGSVERHILALDYSMKYDPLGLPKQLELIQADLDNKALVDPRLMVATLDQIVRNPRYMHLAQIRAEDIIQQIQDKK
jgi:hypothetical protein